MTLQLKGRLSINLSIFSIRSILFILSTFSSLTVRADEGAGQLAAGKSQLSVGGGSAQILGSNYLIIQGRYGYFMADGFVAELGGQTWIPLGGNAGSAYLISPGLTAYLYQAGVVVPYLGTFFQYAVADFELSSQAAVGGRGGILFRQGGSFLGLGARVTQGLDCGASCRETIPEISLFLSF